MNLVRPVGENLLKYDGKLGHLYGIWLVNLFLQIITLSIYRPWARTRLRRYVYSGFSLLGDRLEYSGTGGELFRAFIKVQLYVFFGAFVLTIVLMLAFGLDDNELDAINLLFIPMFYALIYYGKYTGLRYRLSRTRWRGIRGSLRGSPKHYVMLRLKFFFLNIITLGFLKGRHDLIARKYLVENMYFGTQPCTFEGDMNALNRVNAITILLAIPTLFLSRIWYRAAQHRIQLEYMRCGNVSFHGTQTGGNMFALFVGNMLIVLFTLFLGTPIAIHRAVKYFAQHVHITGDVQSFSVAQGQAEVGALGEGISDEFDLDGLDFDMGLI